MLLPSCVLLLAVAVAHAGVIKVFVVDHQSGQPLASTFADYLLPGPTEVPSPRLDHMETLAPYTEFGVKGIGEGGAIAPPAAIVNAVNDALRRLNVELLHSPITPRRILTAIAQAARSTT